MRRLLRVVSAVGWREGRLTSARMDFLRLTLRSCRPDGTSARGAALVDSQEAVLEPAVDKMWVARAVFGKLVGSQSANLGAGWCVKQVGYLPW